MNIFVLDENPKLCAEYHANIHVVKMLLEAMQLLYSTYYFTDSVPENAYKLTHQNHPCSKWVRESLSNWLWLKELATELYKEYKFRYNDKIHKSGELIYTLPMPNINDIGLTKRPQAMDFKYQELDVVVAYRNYYKDAKKDLLHYTKRAIPSWI